MEKILLDTNILIYREDNGIICDNVSKLFQILYDSETFKIVTHPMSVDDINNLKNTELRNITLSKVNLYSQIDNPPLADESFHLSVGCGKNQNDVIDNNLLYAVYRNCASYLITNDTKLRKKAEKLNIKNRVLGINEAIDFFASKEKDNVYIPIHVHKDKIYNIDLNNSFFDTLKDTYYGFEEWFNKKCKNGEECYYTLKEDGRNLGAFLIIKQQSDENEPDFAEQLDSGIKIKICTLKVTDKGKHIGESLLKISFDEAKRVGANQIFLTVFEKEHEDLVDLIKEYGFIKKTTKRTKKTNGKYEIESVYVNCLTRCGYPNLEWNNDSYIVPIKPKFHHKLFPDAEANSQIEITDLISSNPYSNAIKKAYVCNAPVNKIKRGDVLFFYASGIIRGITAIGVIDDIFSNFDSVEEMLSVAKKRTVYTAEEMQTVFQKNNAKVIMFKYYRPIKPPLYYDQLIDKSILKGYPQSITKVNINKLRNLIEPQAL